MVLMVLSRGRARGDRGRVAVVVSVCAMINGLVVRGDRGGVAIPLATGSLSSLDRVMLVEPEH